MRKNSLPQPDEELFYYQREQTLTDEGMRLNHPRVTVCLAKFGDIICRGVSICSFSEPAIKKSESCRRASKRAKLAFKNRNTGLPIFRIEAIAVMNICGALWGKKSYYNVGNNLFGYEQRLIEG